MTKYDGIKLNKEFVYKFVCAFAICLIVLGLTHIGPYALFAVIGLLVSLLIIPFVEYFILPFFALLLGACVLFNEYEINLGFFHVYGADFIIVIFLAASVRLIYCHSKNEAVYKLDRDEGYLLSILMVFMFFGVISLLHGIANNYNLNDAMGMFRRLYFYQFVLFAFILLSQYKLSLNMIKTLPWIVFAGVLCVGMYRIMNDTTYKPELWVYEATIPSPRLLSYTEVASFAFCYAYFLSLALNSKTFYLKLIAVSCFFISMIFMSISGWRLAFIYVIFVPVLYVFVEGIYNKEVYRKITLLKNIVLVILVILMLGSGFFVLFYSFISEPLEQLSQRIESFSVEEDMRYYMWRTAFDHFMSEPWFGKGLGHDFEFFMRASDGQFMSRSASTHNTFITILYQSGIFAFMTYLVFCVYFVKKIVMDLVYVDKEFKSVYFALIAFYLSSLGFSMFQPLQVGHIISIMISMALLLQIIKRSNHVRI